MKIRKSLPGLAHTVNYLVLTIFGITTFYPFIWLFLNAFKAQYEIYSNPFGLPARWLYHNLADAWKMARISTAFINSILVSFSSVILIVIMGALASYAISRKMVPKWVYSYFSIGIMIAAHTVLIPTFAILKGMELFDKPLALILVYTAANVSLAIFILVGFMNSLSIAIEEAAIIDGCSRFRTFIRIVLPMSKSGLATVGTLTFLNCWNEYLFAFVIIRSNEFKTLTQSVMGLQGQYASNIAMLCAGLFISILPVIIIYALLQEQVIKGLTAGAVKG